MQPSGELELTATCRGQGASGQEPPGHPGELSPSALLQEAPGASFSHCRNAAPAAPWPLLWRLRGMGYVTLGSRGALPGFAPGAAETQSSRRAPETKGSSRWEHGPANGAGSLRPVRGSSWGRYRSQPTFIRTPFINEASYCWWNQAVSSSAASLTRTPAVPRRQAGSGGRGDVPTAFRLRRSLRGGSLLSPEVYVTCARGKRVPPAPQHALGGKGCSSIWQSRAPCQPPRQACSSGIDGAAKSACGCCTESKRLCLCLLWFWRYLGT